MLTRQKAFFFAMSFLFFQSTIFGQIIENIEPTVAQFLVVRGSGDPDYTGDLNVSIPLMTVPGRGGLNFDLNLIYVMGNGVTASESASWVGLGWNLNLPQITCSPSYWYHNNPSYWIDGNDRYYLSFPSGSTPIYKFSDGIWRPLKWSGMKIESADTMNINNDYNKDINRFIVTDVDGTRYIFTDFLLQESKQTLRNHCNSSCQQAKHPYRYVFKISSILSSDYVDGNNDLIPENGGTDKGSWIKFTYTQPEDIVIQTFDYHTYTTQVSYLTSITTPTHQAQFALSDSIFHSFINMGSQLSFNGVHLKTLSDICLTTRNTNAYYKNVHFNTTVDENQGAFSWAQYIGNNNYSFISEPCWNYGAYNTMRLRLKSVHIYGYDKDQPEYIFDYYSGPSAGNLSACYLDPWGFYTTEYDYTNKYEETPNPDCYRWMLKKVIYPTGAVESFTYEQDRFQAPSADEQPVMAFSGYGGGLRLKTRSTMVNSSAVDSLTYTYDYAITNAQFPGAGFMSALPFFAKQFTGIIIFGDYPLCLPMQ